MITIQTTPPDIFFAGNPVLYKIHTNNRLSASGQFCSFAIVVSAADTTAGHTIEFAFPSKTVVFITASTPDDSGTQILKASNSASFATWAQTLFDCFQSNFDITSRFQLTLETATAYNRAITFSAFDEGAASNCVITHNLVTVAVMSFVSGLNPIAQKDFCIVGGIWDQNKRQLAGDVKPVDDSGNVTFDFSEYLSALLDYNSLPHFTFPFDPLCNLKIFYDFVLPFYAGFAERYDGAIKKIHFDTIKNAFPGGLNRETLVFYNSNQKGYFEVPENLDKFMTWAPVQKMTGKTVPEKLFFYMGVPTPFDSMTLLVNVHFTDNSQDSFEDAPVSIIANHVIECSVGFEQLQLQSRYPTKTIASWSVRIKEDGGDYLSEIRTFILDPAIYENERVFIFQNSYGRAYDVVRFTGRGTMSLALDFTIGNAETADDFTAFNAPAKKFSPAESQKMITSSGWISRQMKDYLREMLLSRQVFEYKDGLLYPIVITTNSVKEHFVDDEYLYSLELEYDRAYRDFFFSRFNPFMSFSLHLCYCDEYSDDYS
jgi:hypothetical protein